ncbi:MAG: phage tail protein [Acidimicrobiales bacterium]
MSINVADIVAHNKFGLDIDGIECVVLTVSGISSTVESSVLQSVDKAGMAQNLNFISNSNAQHPDITASRVVDGDTAWWDWHKMAKDGDVEGAKKNGSVFFYPTKGDSAKMTFNFTNAIPKGYSIDGLDANSNSNTTETITFSVETLDLA